MTGGELRTAWTGSRVSCSPALSLPLRPPKRWIQRLIKGMAHITGGGLLENVPRMLPEHLTAEMDASTWDVPDVMRWLKRAVNLADDEFARVLNTGLGMVLVVAEEDVEQTTSELRDAGETVFVVGKLIEKSPNMDERVIINQKKKLTMKPT